MSCPRTWEVQAARDGRLGGRELEEHARHLDECADCRCEQRELDELQASLRAVAESTVSVSGLGQGRQALLERALNERNQRVRQHTRHQRPLAVALVAAALGFAIWLGVPRARQSQILVDATRGTSYRRFEADGRPVIQLSNGRVVITVEHAEGEPRLRVVTPDGELEDLGTTFVVEVSAGRTELVEVLAGLVRVSLTGRRVAMLEAGQRFQPYLRPGDPPFVGSRAAEPRASTQSTGSSEPIDPGGVEPEIAAAQEAPPPRHASAPHAGTHRATRRESKPGIGTAAVLPQVESTATEDASSPASRAFAEAVRALDRREAIAAARQFRAFGQTFPADRRAEDAGYLRVVAWLRAGKHAEARNAAAEFLQRYPHGFRRRDVERLLAP